MFNTSPISTKCDITVRTCKLLRRIIPLEEIDQNCLQLSYALFFRLIYISLTFSERDVGTALSYSDKNHFEASFGNGRGAIFEKSSKLRTSLFVTSRWPRSSGQTNYQVHHPPWLWSIDSCQNREFADQYHLRASRAQVSIHRSQVFFEVIRWKFTSFQIIAGSSLFIFNSYEICCVYVPHN